MDAGAAEIIGALFGGGSVVSILWAWGNANKNEFVASLKAQIAQLTENAKSSELARSAAEKYAGELEIKYKFKDQQFKRAVDALNVAHVRLDPSALIGSVPPPPKWDDPSAVWHVEAERQIGYIVGSHEREEAERRRQRPLNPEAERREGLDRKLHRYLADDSEPPTRR